VKRPASDVKRRAVGIAVAAGLAIGAFTVIAAGGDDGDAYLVRAEFDNGSFVIPGEDVKIAGVKVGQIHDVDLTEDNKAAIVLAIEDPAFKPFYKDAFCQIRLQSLIGEQFIECKPTRPRKEGEPLPPELAKVPEGERGEGQYRLPVENNATPVNVDLIQNIQRMPQREGLRILLSELGAGLAANGDELRAAVRRANPALRETDRVIRILAEQDRQLGRLVDESDQVLAAWVQKRKETADFIDKAGITGAAAAERGDDIERNFERLPTFLREFKPTADAFAGLADQMTPALDSLESQAPAINATIRRFGPFSDATTPALTSLGDFADRARQLFPAIRPLVGDLRRLGAPARPATTNLAKLLGSVDDTGGIEELMKLIYYYTGATNGVDEKGHYVRAGVVTGTCSVGRYIRSGSCSSDFENFRPESASTSSVPTPADDDFGGLSEPMLDYLFGSEELGK
jgi:ABC-type transporter Mla subunit MlaD